MTPRLPTLFRWQMVRNLGRKRLLALLNLVGVALGVAVYLAIQIANQSANQSFAAGVDLVAGKAHLEARGKVPDALYPALAATPGVSAATPLLEGVLPLPDHPGEYLRLLGVDVFSNSPFSTYVLGGFRVERWLSGPGQIAVSEAFAERMGLKPGDTFTVLAASRPQTVTVAFLMQPEKGRGGAERFAIMDLGWAQELLGRQGQLTSIQFLLQNPLEPDATAAALRAQLPADATVDPPRQRSRQLEEMVGAFQLNLTALSLVSLLVGMFLIYNTVLASVARHRREIGILRAIGASRREVSLLFLGEALLFGCVGTVLGMVGGILLSRELVGAVSQTVSSLYVLTRIASISIDPWHLAVAGVLGVGSVLIAAWNPAREAARMPPLEALAPGGYAELPSPRKDASWLAAGAGSLGLAALSAWVALGWNIGWLGFACAFFVLFGFACFARAATVVVAWLAGVLTFSGRPVLVRLAGQGLRRSLRRNAVTVGALAAAIAMMVAVSVMIFSFRNSLEAWLDRTVMADLYIAPASNEVIGLQDVLPPGAVEWARAQPGVRCTNTFREMPVLVAGERALLSVVERGCTTLPLPFTGGRVEEKMARFMAPGAVAVTESFARRFGLGAGDELLLPTPAGERRFHIAGVFRDYTRDAGVIQIDRAEFDRHWADPGINSLSISIHPGADAAGIGDAFRHHFREHGLYTAYPNAALRARIMTIFDQTFAVTSVLRIIAVLVAAVGVFLSVTTAVMEREREIGILRAMGASPGQVRGLFLAEAGLTGLAASGLGLLCGGVLAWVLTGVLNRVFFGWSIDISYPWLLLAATPLWIVPVALVAAWMPGWFAARRPASEAVRTE